MVGANTSTLAVLSEIGRDAGNASFRVGNITGSFWGSWAHGSATIYENTTLNASSSIGVMIGVPEEDVPRCTLPVSLSQQFSEHGGSIILWVTDVRTTDAFPAVAEVNGVV